jgi:hypothetical protein
MHGTFPCNGQFSLLWPHFVRGAKNEREILAVIPHANLL